MGMIPPERRPVPAPSAPGRLEIAVAAVIRRDSGPAEVLIARRHDSAIRGGLWELPGGKVSPGESPAEAAARELAEETGLQVRAADGRIVARVEHDDDRLSRERSLALVLVAFDAPAAAVPRPLASAECRWERLDRLDRYAWPAANLELNRLLVAHVLRERPS